MFSFLKRSRPATPAPTAAPSQPPAFSLPADVLSLLRRRDDLNDPELRIHLLDEQTALARYGGTSVWGRLGLVTLDDADDSNPYVLITRGVCAGMVAHFFHDPEPQVEFQSLQAFEDHLRDLRRRRVAIDEEPREPTAHPDQPALAGALLELACADEDVDADWLICFYTGLLRADHRGVLEVLATHPSFFVREAVAEALVRIDDPRAHALLERLAAEGESQVADAAGRSLARRAGERRR